MSHIFFQSWCLKYKTALKKLRSRIGTVLHSSVTVWCWLVLWGFSVPLQQWCHSVLESATHHVYPIRPCACKLAPEMSCEECRYTIHHQRFNSKRIFASGRKAARWCQHHHARPVVSPPANQHINVLELKVVSVPSFNVCWRYSFPRHHGRTYTALGWPLCVVWAAHMGPFYCLWSHLEAEETLCRYLTLGPWMASARRCSFMVFNAPVSSATTTNDL